MEPPWNPSLIWKGKERTACVFATSTIHCPSTVRINGYLVIIADIGLAFIGCLGINVLARAELAQAQMAEMAAGELDFYRRQFRRRIQTSALLGILAVMIFLGELLALWVNSHVFFFIYWAAALVLVVWVALLAAADIWATQYHFGQLRQKCLVEQAKLHAEIRRVQSIRGNGKPPGKKDSEF